MKPFLLLHLIVVGTIILPPSVRGATYSTGFSGSLYSGTSQLAGQDGWTVNDSTPSLSFFAHWNGNPSGALGGYLDAPASTHVDLIHPYGGTLAGAAFAVDFALIASTTEHPGADSFGYSFTDASNHTILRVAFEPNGGPSSDSLEIVWYDAANTRTSTDFDLFYGSDYKMDLTFGANGSNGLFSLTIGNVLGSVPLALNTVLPGAGAAILASFGVDWDIRGSVGTSSGDNFMVFDKLLISGPSVRLPIPLNIALNPSNQPVISFQGVAGTSYQVHLSTTMLPGSWSLRETVVAPAGGLVQFIDTSAPASQGFYRVAIAP